MTRLDELPGDCIARVLSFTSPRDACNSSAVSTAFRAAADSDLLWDHFLPSDYPEILCRLVSPMVFSSKKDLFRRLCSGPLLVDEGRKTFSLDKPTGKKCYMLCARMLSITWGSNPLYWCWKNLKQSRFSEVVELILIWWLDINGKMNTKTLSPNTVYGAYLVVEICDRAHGLSSIPSEVSVEVGTYKSQGAIYIRRKDDRKKVWLEEGFCIENSLEVLRPSRAAPAEEMVPQERGDGWLEIELGEFYNDGSEREVKMSLREVKGPQLKGGLVVEGIELRPKC